MVHSIQQGRLLYGLGASQEGAVRAIHSTSNKLVTAGDDGNVLIFTLDF
ncbi:unnamed protein product [Heterosigma akashiwo]